jgi:hypothetical protein
MRPRAEREAASLEAVAAESELGEAAAEPGRAPV